MNRKDFTPALMSMILLVGIVVFVLARQWRMPSAWLHYAVNMDIVFIGLYVLWILAETPITKKDANTEGKKTLDFATCQLYGLGQALTILSALWFPSVWQAPHMTHVAGLVLFLFGVMYRLWAIRTLGVFYAHKVRTVEQHKIVDTGPYLYTRHPAYAGMILANAGVTVYFLNWVTLSIFLLVLFPAIVFRIFIEERVLFEIEGYADFAQKRKRLFPGIW